VTGLNLLADAKAADISHYPCKSHCRGFFELQIAA
jgi:hypothetical protein